MISWEEIERIAWKLTADKLIFNPEYFEQERKRNQLKLQAT